MQPDLNGPDDESMPAYLAVSASEFGIRPGSMLRELDIGAVIAVTDHRTGRTLYLTASRELPASLARVADMLPAPPARAEVLIMTCPGIDAETGAPLDEAAGPEPAEPEPLDQAAELESDDALAGV